MSSHMDRQVSASEAKTHLLRLLDEVEHGTIFTITRHGRPVARLVPERDQRQVEIDQAVARIQEARRHRPRVSVEEILSARNEGRK